MHKHILIFSQFFFKKHTNRNFEWNETYVLFAQKVSSLIRFCFFFFHIVSISVFPSPCWAFFSHKMRSWEMVAYGELQNGTSDCTPNKKTYCILSLGDFVLYFSCKMHFLPFYIFWCLKAGDGIVYLRIVHFFTIIQN